MVAADYTSSEYTKFNLALLTTLSRYRDVSVRDGNQSLDANKWTIDQVVTVLKEENKFALLLKEFAKNTSKEELLEAAKGQSDHLLNHFFKQFPDTKPEQAVKWYAQVIGGGCFLQNARFLGENGFDNMKKMAEAAPDIIKFDLDRGGQLYAMVSNNPETQKVVREYMMACGLNDKKVFDMMNDSRNFKRAIDIIKEIRGQQRTDGVPEDKIMKAAGAISVIGPNKEGKRIIPLERYGKMAVDLIKMGYDDIYIKDYAGQFIGIKESLDLAKAINGALKDALDKGEIQKMPNVFWHSHGHKPEVLKALLDSGTVQQVDVAIGDLSGASSHTNMRDLLAMEMKAKGFDINDEKYKNQPVLKQFGEVEYTINEISKVHKKYRVANVVSDQEVYDSKIAGGAVAALWALINRDWKKISSLVPDLKGSDDEKKIYLLKEGLKTNHDVWDVAGQFNTVTPGATICYDKAFTKDTLNRIAKGVETHIFDHTQQYKDIVKGRWGVHIAIDEGLFDDKGLRNAYLAFDSIKLLRDASSSDKELVPVYNKFMKNIGMDTAEFNRSNPDLEQRLRKLDISKVSSTLEKIKFELQDKLYENMKYELSTAHFRDAPEGMEYALGSVDRLAQQHNVQLNDEERQHWAKTILACRTNDLAFAVGENLFVHLVVNKGIGRVGSIEPERFGDLEDLLKTSKAYEDFVKFKGGTTEIKELLKEQGYGSPKEPQVVYGQERFERFMKGKLFEIAEKDIIRNLIVYAQKRINPEKLTGVTKFSGRKMGNKNHIEGVMNSPVRPVWHELKRVVSEFSDELMNIILKPENKKQIVEGIEKVKDKLADKIALYYGYTDDDRKPAHQANTDWVKRTGNGNNGKEWDGIVREG